MTRVGKMTGARCKDCGRVLVVANIPGRGIVTAHRHGERKLCDQQKMLKKQPLNGAPKP